MIRDRSVLVTPALLVLACSSKGGASSPSGIADAAPKAALVVPAVPQPDCNADAGDWPMFGHNVCNTSSPLFAGGITKQNVGKLKTKWIYDATGDVPATPAVVGGYVYVPDWGGMINGRRPLVLQERSHRVWSARRRRRRRVLGRRLPLAAGLRQLDPEALRFCGPMKRAALIVHRRPSQANARYRK